MKNPFMKLGESYLYHIWDGGHLRRDQLKTTQRQRIEVLFPGRWNMDSGPDFKGAILKLNGELKKGDIEIHVKSLDWYLHQHQKDEKYNDVILHAVLSHDIKSKPCQTQSGHIIPTLVLGDFFDESVSRLHVKKEFHDGQLKKKWPDVCLLRSKPAHQIESVLEHWGLERLFLKKERFKEEKEYFQFNDLMYQGICEALGFSKNREPFLKLAFLLPINVVWKEIFNVKNDEALLKLQSLFFGTAGLLLEAEQNIMSTSLEVSQFIQRLKFYWYPFKEKYQQNQMKFVEWQFFRLRPMNFPSVRIAGLCKFLLSKRQTGFVDPVLATFRDLSHKPEKIFSELQNQFIAENFGIWKKHYQFSDPHSAKKDYRLIGSSKAREIVINVVLPVIFAYAEETEDYKLQDLVKIVYLNSPRLESNQVIRRMSQQLNLEKSEKKQTQASACQQQGLLHMAKVFCPKWHCHQCIQPNH